MILNLSGQRRRLCSGAGSDQVESTDRWIRL